MRALTEYFPQIYLIANSIVYGVLAVLFVTDANTWFANLEILPRSPVGLTELKTMYIGLMAAIGIFSMLSALFNSLRLAGLTFALISYSMLAGVRSYGIFVDGVSSDLMTLLLSVEIMSALLALLALFFKSSR